MPVPGHVRFMQTLRMGWPQSTEVAAGHIEMHSHIRVVVLHRNPDAHWSPVPHDGPPGHTLGTSCPHGTALRLTPVGQRGAHTHVPPWQT